MTIEYKIVEEYPKDVLADLMKRNLEDDQVFIHPDTYLGTGDVNHKRTGKSVKIAAYDGERIVGVSYGIAINKHRFMMDISLVEKEYRDQGIYSSMLEMMLENTREFDEIDSCHHQFNNLIIAKKLRSGFHILSMEIGPATGSVVRLRYFNNQKLYSVMRFRTGLIPQSSIV